MNFEVGLNYTSRNGELWECIKLPAVSLPTFKNDSGKIIVQSPNGKYRWDYNISKPETHHERDFV